MPVPTSRSTSASAKSSDSGAQAAGIRVPATSKWFMFRVIERPRAPASSASRTTPRMIASSASVAGRSEHASPMAYRRTAECPTRVPTLTPRRRPMAAMYSGNVSHVHGTPAARTSIGIAST